MKMYIAEHCGELMDKFGYRIDQKDHKDENEKQVAETLARPFSTDFIESFNETTHSRLMAYFERQQKIQANNSVKINFFEIKVNDPSALIR